MSHQEAIDRLKAQRTRGKDIWLTCRDDEALVMAVAALQAILDAQPKPAVKIAGRITSGQHI